MCFVYLTQSNTVLRNGMEGRTSDKHITENCGILDKLSHGNVVLTDSGTGRNMSTQIEIGI